MNEQVSSTICKQFSKTRQLIILVSVIFTILLVIGIILLTLASIKPCLFTKCHSKASQCINRFPFKAQCICNADTSGNGRTICDECGVKNSSPTARIIGGADVPIHSWPFTVLIRQRYKNIVNLKGKSYLVSTSWLCGGTLINHKTILTAAHCLRTESDTFDYESMEIPIVWNKYYPNLESTLEVSVGLYDRRKQNEQHIVKVLKAIPHPLYDNKNLLNDIAIIKLNDYIRPSKTIQFACLTKSSLDINITGTVVGFGDTATGARQSSFILQQVNLTIYPNDFCSNVVPSAVKNWDLQLCCGDLKGERDTCQGDSGGGLYIQRNVSNIIRYTIAGIVSYGEQCASPMKPGIYTRVLNYIDWIRQNSDFDITEI